MGCASSQTAAASARHKLQTIQQPQAKQEKRSPTIRLKTRPAPNDNNNTPTATTTTTDERKSSADNNNSGDDIKEDTVLIASQQQQDQHSDKQFGGGGVVINNNDSNNSATASNQATSSARPTTETNRQAELMPDEQQTNSYGEPGSLMQFDNQNQVHEQLDERESNSTDPDNTAIKELHQESHTMEQQQQQNTWDMNINMDLLNEYIQVSHEISELESRDALHVYHDRIEQLEQLDQELDLTSRDAEEMARQARQSATSSNAPGDEGHGTSSRPIEHNKSNKKVNIKIEEIFAKKILLEKERDKLKQEVEKVILECDRLQQRYKKRDEILDKIFDGHFGGGLENHLEKQLDWLLEQKHYVDQVFYAWKRAETLATQACEQFSRALDEFRKIERGNLDKDQFDEVARGIYELCTKSRLDIERAQKYNPNVDAPFYTEDGTDNFDSVIDSIITGEWNQFKKNKVKTTIEVAYKRAISIRQWLGQILQTTIARDSFELAEEYRWIAIQLRKERINLIKARIQESPITSLASSTSHTMPNSREVNRDSGVESENNDIDLEEEIDRLLKKDRATRQEQHMGDRPIDRLIAPSKYQDFSAGFKRKDIQPVDKLANEYERGQLAKAIMESKSGSIMSTASSFKTLPHVEVDEEAKKSLIAQIDKLHEDHRRQLERHQRKNQAKISSAIRQRIQRRNELRKEGSESATQSVSKLAAI